MPRYNKIFAGPVTEPTPQVTEAAAADAALIFPGSLIKLDASGEWVLSGAGTDNSKMFIAQDDYLSGALVTDILSAASGDLFNAIIQGLEMLPSQFFYARLADSETIVKGDLLMTSTAGDLVAHTGVSARVIATADESLTTATGVELIRVRPTGAHNFAIV